MSSLVQDLMRLSLVSLGIVLGGSILGALGALFSHEPPLQMMKTLADRLRIWAAVASLGGSFYTLRSIESGLVGLFDGDPISSMRQILFIISAFGGAQMGQYLIYHFAGDV